MSHHYRMITPLGPKRVRVSQLQNVSDRSNRFAIQVDLITAAPPHAPRPRWVRGRCSDHSRFTFRIRSMIHHVHRWPWAIRGIRKPSFVCICSENCSFIVAWYPMGGFRCCVELRCLPPGHLCCGGRARY